MAILRVRAECPVTSWDESFELSAGLFDRDGVLMTCLTSEAPSEQDKAVVHREDSYATNIRHRTIDLNLLACTYRANPRVAMIVLAISVSSSATLADFERRGRGTVKLTWLTEKSDPIDLFDFPLGYSHSCNAQILGSLVHDLASKLDVSVAKRRPDAELLARWRLKFTTNTLHGTVTDLVRPMEAEFAISAPLVERNDLAGCLPLVSLHRSKKELMQRISATPLAEEKRDRDQAEKRHPLLGPDGSICLPFDKVSAEVRRVWDRQNMQDDNLRDLWTVVAALRSELQFRDNEMKIVDHLAQRMEAFETVMLDMFYGTTNLVKNIREAMALTHGQDLSENTVRGAQRQRLGELFDNRGDLYDGGGGLGGVNVAAGLGGTGCGLYDSSLPPLRPGDTDRLQQLLDTTRPSGRPDGLPAAYGLAYETN